MRNKEQCAMFTGEMYFYSNACHVCRAYGKNVQLKRCSSCKMIAYCGKEHQSKHWQRHKDLCKLLGGIVKQVGNAFGAKSKRETSMESWTRAKTNLMLLIQMKLGRKLLPYEMEMFKFPRACAICHETDSRLLNDCQNCPGTSFCLDHNCNDSHRTKCKTLKLCFDIETSTISLSKTIENIVDFSDIDDKYIPKTMQDIVDVCFHEKNLLQSKILSACVSECLTRPMTFLFALDILNVKEISSTTIHIIGANAIEIESLIYWETLLHRKKNLIELKIILIGPELCQDNYKINLCDNCVSKNRKIHVETVDMLYADYAASKNFVDVDYVIGFNLGIHEYEEHSSINDTWALSLKELTKQNCPFVMTSYTRQESLDEQKRLGIILDNNINYCYSGKNPFSSLRPYRDFESEDFFYQNHYVTIYKKLC